ncbi:MAG: polyphosphate polymerase domain-containing protein [Clostridia bacterium]
MSEAYRHELKYLINMPDYALLRARMLSVLSRDPNTGPTGEYWIRSLYFDDYWNTGYEDKEGGYLLRKKYRIRVYNCADDLIRLERKKKFGAYIYKQAAPLTRPQVQSILEGDYAFLLQSEHALLREFYFECTSRIMRPRVIVDYDREPFVMEAGDVRITFDKHVRAGMGRFELFDTKLPTLETLPGNQMIMEVKYTQFLPAEVKTLLPPRASLLTAASKYVLCCDACARTENKVRTEGLQWRAR